MDDLDYTVGIEEKIVYRAVCPCRWTGDWRPSWKQANHDAENHEEHFPPLKPGAKTGLDDGPPDSIVRHK